MIRAVIFDFFGVIRTDGFNQWMNTHGIARDGKVAEASDHLDKGKINTSAFFDLLSEASGQPAKDIQQEMDADMTLIDGMEAILRELHSSCKLALLSNSASAYLRGELAKYDLEKYFDLIVISSEVGMAKPHAEIFSYILNKLQLSSSEVIFIDDNPKHIESAKEVGIKGIVFTDAAALRSTLGMYFKL